MDGPRRILLISGSLREGSTNTGALPGSFKNLLEWTVGDASTYRKPVAWINASGTAAPTGGADAHDSLRKVLGYVHAWIVEAACRRIPIARAAVAADGTIEDQATRQQIRQTLATLADQAGQREAEDARSG
jgi:chromate reductase, NAD(P)H dehydrogenase (quinone)